MLVSIKTLQRFSKATLNSFFYKKIFDDDKNLIYMIDFLCQIQILLLNMLELLKIPEFFSLN